MLKKILIDKFRETRHFLLLFSIPFFFFLPDPLERLARAMKVLDLFSRMRAHMQSLPLSIFLHARRPVQKELMIDINNDLPRDIFILRFSILINFCNLNVNSNLKGDMRTHIYLFVRCTKESFYFLSLLNASVKYN